MKTIRYYDKNGNKITEKQYHENFMKKLEEYRRKHKKEKNNGNKD